jgi:ankyrin repeat protein
MTDIHTLAKDGKTEEIKAAIALGADIHAKNNDGYTALMLVSDNGTQRQLRR